MNAHRLCTISFSVVVGLFAVAASAQNYIIDAFPIEQDTYIDSRDPNHNYGVGTTEKVVVNGADGSLSRALFKLPDSLWTIPSDQLISARIWFYVWKDRTAERMVTLHPLIKDFTAGSGDGTFSQDGATWETCDGITPWTCTGGDYDARTFVDGKEFTNWFCWEITPLWDDAHLRSFGAMLKMSDESDPGDPNMPRAPFTSSEGPTSERPYIEVTYYVD